MHINRINVLLCVLSSISCVTCIGTATEPSTPKKIVVIGENSSPNTKLCVQSAIQANAFWSRFKKSQQEKSAAINEEKEILKKDLASAQENLKTTSEKLQSKIKSNDDLSKLNAELTKEKDDAIDALNSTKQQLDERDKNIEQLSNERDTLRETAKKASADLKEQISKNESLSNEHEKVKKQLEDQIQTNISNKSTIDDLTSKNAKVLSEKNTLAFEKYLQGLMDNEASTAVGEADRAKRESLNLAGANIDLNDPDQTIAILLFNTANLSVLRQYESFDKLRAFVPKTNDKLVYQISSVEKEYDSLVEIVGANFNEDNVQTSSEVSDFLASYRVLMTNIYNFAFDKMSNDSDGTIETSDPTEKKDEAAIVNPAPGNKQPDHVDVESDQEPKKESTSTIANNEFTATLD